MRSARVTGLVLLGLSVFVLGGKPASADVVHDWNVQALSLPFMVGPPQARMLAMVHLAMFDAITSVTGDYEPYAIRVPHASGASPEAAAAAAAHTVLVSLIPAMAAQYDAALAASLNGIPEPGRSLGVAVGVEVGTGILALRNNDGFSAPVTYTPGNGPGAWVPTFPAFLPALLPGFGRVLPFALRSGDQFRPDGPPLLSSDQWAADFNEVKMRGAFNAEALGHRTAAETATARFWLGNMIPIMQGIARQASAARNLDLVENARFFALLNVAGVDAYIAAWDAKYAYNFWRPITAIRNAETDGNPATEADPTWESFGITPPFPDYVSGHTAYTRACVTVLEDVFGKDMGFTATNPAVPSAERTRTYARFRDFSDEMIEARILAGIHYRTADRDGDRVGSQVARFAITHILRRSHGQS